MSLLPAAAAAHRPHRRLPGRLPELLALALLAGCTPHIYRLGTYEGSVGEELPLYGRHLRRVREVRFGGVPQEFYRGGYWRVRGYTGVQVPEGAATGPLTLVTAAGRVVPTSYSFTVVPADSARRPPADDDNLAATLSLVRWLAVQPDGRILVGGDFSQLQGQSRPGLARLLADGRLDPTFVPPPDLLPATPLLALVRPGGRVLLSVRQGPAPLVQLLPDGRPDPNFQSDSLDAAPTALAALPGGRLLLGYDNYDATDSLHLRRLLPDGRPDPDFTEPDWSILTDTAQGPWEPHYLNGVQALACRADGQLLVALEAYASESHLLRCRPDGTPLATDVLSPNVGYGATESAFTSAHIWGIFPQADGHVVVGRRIEHDYFNSYSLLRLDSASRPVGWVVPPRLGSLDQTALLQPDDKLLLATVTFTLPWRTRWLPLGRPPTIAHYFEPPSPAARRRMWRHYHAGVLQAAWQGRADTRRWLRRLLPDGRPDPGFRPGPHPPDGPVCALALQPDGKVLVGGNFTHYQGHAVYGVLRLHPDGSFDPTFHP